MTNEEFQRLLFEELKVIRGEIATKQELADIKTNVANLERQLSEINQFVKVLLHHIEEIEAKLDDPVHNTASKEVADRIETKLDVLNQRLFNLEAGIQLLKRTK